MQKMKTLFACVLVLALLVILAVIISLLALTSNEDNASEYVYYENKYYKDIVENATIFELNAGNDSRFWTTGQQQSMEYAENAITRTVLFWNTLHYKEIWYLPTDTVRLKCPLAQCIFTTQHKFLPVESAYDAIIYHGRQAFEAPKQRDSRQSYVFVLLESPEYTYPWMWQSTHVYNLTMTFRLDSDIKWPYNRMLSKADNKVVAPSFQTNWLAMNSSWTSTNKTLLEKVKKKKKLIAWFVSHCETASKREKLVAALKQYVQVDVFGECGNLSCGPILANECNDMLNNEYKFYLSFENSLCKDYVTEKFYNALTLDIVPIVYGGANYSHFGPPHSYIDVQDFENVQELVTYLLYLDKDPVEYASYFWWKRYYRVAAETGNLTLPYCDLCHHLNSQAAQQRIEIYPNLKSFWFDGMCSKKARILF